MWYTKMFDEIENSKDEAQAVKMSAYMQNKFVFLGLPKPVLSAIIKPYFKTIPKEKVIDWEFVNICWDKEYREAQYVAIDYLRKEKKLLIEDDFSKLKKLIITKSWWETVDLLDTLVGILAKEHKSIWEEMIRWSTDDNIWLRRVSIDFQLLYKEYTDKEYLSAIIKNNLGSKEFYINKAIGWSLREYSKINQEWVSDFIQNNKDEMSKLSIREASKYIRK